MKSPEKSSTMHAFYGEIASKTDKILLEWEDINYTVRVKSSKKSTFFKTEYQNNRILCNLKGRAESGQLLAIMGPTGCGKTSLLNILAARMPSGGSANAKLTGSVYVDGFLRNDHEFIRQSAYVLQDDKLYPHLTVQETLTLAAHFYLPTSVSDETKEELVASVIAELGLVKAKNTIIGDEKIRGVSGGERKRANIATQLISQPAALFLDEPTSGLDSFQALSVMECMKAMAVNGRLIVSVIHQPRSSIYDMFDQLLLLSCGQTVFYGAAKDAVGWFASKQFTCPRLFNPSDYFLDILSPDNRTPELETQTTNQINYLAQEWRVQEEKHPSSPRNKEMNHVTSFNAIANIQSFDFHRFYRNFRLLCWRSFTEQVRDIPTIAVKLMMTCFFSLIIGGVYSKRGNGQKIIQNHIGLLFVIAINQGFGGVLGVANVFPKEKIIVNRERSSNAYDVVSYFCAKFIVETPLNTAPACIFACIIYWIVGLKPETFGYFILIVMLEALTGVSLGLAVSAMAPNVDAALGMAPAFVIIALIFGGFYVNISTLPIVANWVPYLSFLKWAFEALCINEFKGQTFDCDGSSAGACDATGESVLDRLGFGGKTTGEAVLGLSMLLVGFSGSALIFLYLSGISYIQLGWVGKNMKHVETEKEGTSELNIAPISAPEEIYTREIEMPSKP